MSEQSGNHNLTDEQRAEVQRITKEAVESAFAHMKQGRSSMPMLVDDVLILAGIAATQPIEQLPPDGAHFFATFGDGSLAECSCGHQGNLIEHASEALAGDRGDA